MYQGTLFLFVMVLIHFVPIVITLVISYPPDTNCRKKLTKAYFLFIQLFYSCAFRETIYSITTLQFYYQ